MTPGLANLVPAAVVLGFVGLGVARSVAVWRRHGVNPYAFGLSDSPRDFVGHLHRLVFGIGTAFLLARTAWPGLDRYAGSFEWVRGAAAWWAGLVLMAAGAGFALLAQARMGAAWRVGIPDTAPPSVVRDGPFALSRNPIFLGMSAILAGAFLMAPTGVVLALLATGLVAFNVQARLEEEYLLRHGGPDYAAYRGRVRRWL